MPHNTSPLPFRERYGLHLAEQQVENARAAGMAPYIIAALYSISSKHRQGFMLPVKAAAVFPTTPVLEGKTAHGTFGEYLRRHGIPGEAVPLNRIHFLPPSQAEEPEQQLADRRSNPPHLYVPIGATVTRPMRFALATSAEIKAGGWHSFPEALGLAEQLPNANDRIVHTNIVLRLLELPGLAPRL